MQIFDTHAHIGWIYYDPLEPEYSVFAIVCMIFIRYMKI